METYSKCDYSQDENLPSWSSAHYQRCIFSGSYMGTDIRDPRKRIVISDVKFTNCQFKQVDWCGVSFHNVEFENCWFKSINRFDACLYSNVKFTGSHRGTYLGSHRWDIGRDINSPANKAFIEANQQAYEQIDVAIDLSDYVMGGQAYSELLTSGVPISKIVKSKHGHCEFINYKRMVSLLESGLVEEPLADDLETQMYLNSSDFVYLYASNDLHSAKFIEFCAQNDCIIS
ncbi:pentapeptide repeat-containing protein [Persicirhabdus sediminis]|uniref:Pentapeptide repeat-containing protein n=1 Tax=Persicirhabdus sediminis TaxID=454144 RepID=A0A8J7MCV5_9BACT|nr:pentapeptide repeat-containing protein [Persicirhabdus sediminis]MBK1790857.1 pentapeptide repeat-containing protein [Persicirhabdus sediminis]